MGTDLASKPGQITEALRARIQWGLAEENGIVAQLYSIAAEQKHVLIRPQGSDGTFPVAVELARARLAETVTPLFSTPLFVPGTPNELFNPLLPFFDTPGEWFGHGALHDLAPEAYLAWLEERFAAITPSAVTANVKVLTSSALVLGRRIAAGLSVGEGWPPAVLEMARCMAELDGKAGVRELGSMTIAVVRMVGFVTEPVSVAGAWMWRIGEEG